MLILENNAENNNYSSKRIKTPKAKMLIFYQDYIIGIDTI